jgi:hypothetical protein
MILNATLNPPPPPRPPRRRLREFLTEPADRSERMQAPQPRSEGPSPWSAEPIIAAGRRNEEKRRIDDTPIAARIEPDCGDQSHAGRKTEAHQEACRRQDKNTEAGAPLGVGEDGWVVVPTLAGGSDSSCRPGQFPTADDTPPRAKPARERLGPLKPRKPVAKGLIELSRSMMRSITERDKLLSGEGYVRSALDVRFQPSCRQVSTGESRG